MVVLCAHFRHTTACWRIFCSHAGSSLGIRGYSTGSGSCSWFLTLSKFPRFICFCFCLKYILLHGCTISWVSVHQYTLRVSSTFWQSWAMILLKWLQFSGSFLKAKAFNYMSFPRARVWEGLITILSHSHSWWFRNKFKNRFKMMSYEIGLGIICFKEWGFFR